MTTNERKTYIGVAHRGWPEHYPENTLIGFIAAAEAGASAIELDVQISADGVPIVIHDSTLSRTSNTEAISIHNATTSTLSLLDNISQISATDLTHISVHEPLRFGDHYQPCPLSTLQQVCNALADYAVDVFIEIKEESMAFFSHKVILDAVLNACQILGNKAIIISFDDEVLRLTKQQSSLRTGWVIRQINAHSHHKAQQLAADILCYDVKKVSHAEQLWQGPWQWFLYDIVDPQQAEYWYQQGVHYIETWDITALSKPLSLTPTE